LDRRSIRYGLGLLVDVPMRKAVAEVSRRASLAASGEDRKFDQRSLSSNAVVPDAFGNVASAKRVPVTSVLLDPDSDGADSGTRRGRILMYLLIAVFALVIALFTGAFIAALRIDPCALATRDWSMIDADCSRMQIATAFRAIGRNRMTTVTKLPSPEPDDARLNIWSQNRTIAPEERSIGATVGGSISAPWVVTPRQTTQPPANGIVWP
jgi:hypothetical protein